ncbi:LOW QUALITY PROTEIN: atrial natriuretic peptide-converting enzyme [Electrophorus electricus]|uniref:LOW QUALITY PROTEIN: atrial natriuretic peptide-converting enzyme n=1 Tax=Electrophorus electricus TaxID=8005 RepID=UPI0015D01522|nr:LOW QUALITY PROTEIN: atrial natriuretic peptide-converting enzyme [Electrophorus electricus]
MLSSEQLHAPGLAEPCQQTAVSRADVQVMGDSCAHKLGSVKHLRLLLLILLPCVCGFVCFLTLLLAFTGIIGKGLLDSGDSSPLSSMYDSTATLVPLMTLSTSRTTINQTMAITPGTVATFQSDSSTADLTTHETSSQSSSSVIPTPVSTTDWLMAFSTMSSMGTLSSVLVSPTSASHELGTCSDISEGQCRILPYNQSGVLPGATVVKSGELEMFLKFFSYLNRLSCYRHIMLFGCAIALPQCIQQSNSRRLVLPCQAFCEAAREGCEPVLQMFNASWPEFLRCSQFTNITAAMTGPQPACYTPRHVKGKPSVCGGSDNFLCATGICVPQKLVCNGFNDCDDWSDEADCICGEGEFGCGTGRCVNVSLLCDGYDDCGDLSDEYNCRCDPVREHQCGDGRCIPPEWLCDGDHDCLDNSDELNCSCKAQGLLECENGQCIPSAFYCDGDNDCKDGSDEENCTKQLAQGSCPLGQPSCVSTSCSPECSGNVSCELWNASTHCTGCEPISLELCMNLPYNSTRFPNFLGHQSQKETSVSWESSLFPALVQTSCYKYLMFFACTLLVPKCDPVTYQRVPPCRSLCRSSRDRCELVLSIVGLQWPEDTDCAQFPDEGQENTSCLLPDPDVDECSPSHFKCQSGRCVLASKRCDGHLDCDDDSDEDNCGCRERGLWECPDDKACLQHSMICDGFPDCSQQEDERNCSVCSDNELECINHECVHRTLWCDGRKHCSDSSDEWNCVSLSASSVLLVSRTAAEYQVCADEWNPHLSTIACTQLGLGSPLSTDEVEDVSGSGRRRWLHVHPDWRQRNSAALQGLLEKRGHACYSRKRIALQCTEDECGRRPAARMVKRILGGRTSRPGRWPWQCSLQSEPSGHICGCVLIHRRWALTVAHCFEGRESAGVWKVVLGINNLDHPSDHMQTRRVKRVIVHSRYNRAVVDYDISIMELDSEVEVTSYVRPVCLPEPGHLPPYDTYCYITGWGHMGNRMPFKLQEGEVRIISLSQCQSYFDMKTITSRMLCAGYEAGTIDSCMGDSGGPLVCAEPSGRWSLYGLTSWGSVCFSKVLGPGVYANVTHFTEWIQRQIYLHTFHLV